MKHIKVCKQKRSINPLSFQSEKENGEVGASIEPGYSFSGQTQPLTEVLQSQGPGCVPSEVVVIDRL